MVDDIYKPFTDKAKSILSRLTPEEIEQRNETDRLRAEQLHVEFIAAFRKGQCSFCNKPLKTFSARSVCFHWLLRPKGVKKKHIGQLLEEFGFNRSESYLRWVANAEAPIRNINDLPADEKRVIETTIKYVNLEWSYSCSPSDLNGHGNTKFPHFHFQFRIDQRPFVNFSDFHIKFHEADLLRLAMQNQSEIPYNLNQGHGAGTRDIFDDSVLEEVMQHAVLSSNSENSLFETDTIVVANPGETISGDVLADIIEESRRTGVPMSRLVDRLNGDATTYVSEGEGVAEKASRTKTKRSK